MASAPTPALLERSDVHKSCKVVEQIVNLLNDFCEATSALVGVQRKLHRAMKDAAQSKGNGEVPINALLSSSKILESIVDVDSKFSKIADKECEHISAEVRKWFKKLQKEEKAHDDRIATANNKIKNAAQAYEKATKKKSNSALDEHARYMNIINTVGPEISQDRYNHTLYVSQHHSNVVLALCACLGRVADAQWLRNCETVKRCSPNIGSVGQWRAYCEGEWNSHLPNDLPDSETSSTADSPITGGGSTRESSAANSDERSNRGLSTPIPSPHPIYERRHITPLPSPATTPRDGISPISTSPPSYSDQTRDGEFDPSSMKSTGPGFATLTASFPAPPTHTPSRIRKSSLAAMNISQDDLRAALNAGSPTPASPTDGNKSRVAEMRDKYDRPSGSQGSPTARENETERVARRSSTHVANLASRYDVGGSPRSPPPLARSPPSAQSGTMSPGTPFPSARPSSPPHFEKPTTTILPLNTQLTSEPESIAEKALTGKGGEKEKDEDDPTLRATDRRKRIQELQALQFEEQEYILKEQERVLKERADALEREKEKLRQGLARAAHGAESSADMSSTGDEQSERGGRARYRHGGHEREGQQNRRPYREPSYSLSFTQLPSATSTTANSTSPNQHGRLQAPRKKTLSISGASSPGASMSELPHLHPVTPGHSIGCTCVSCVLARSPAGISAAAASAHLRGSKPEKPKGWIRRLSTGFTSDNKRNSGYSNPYGTGIGSKDFAKLPPPNEEGMLHHRSSFDSHALRR